MNREQWAKLSPDEQRIKVAELCGWKNCGYRFQDGKINDDGVFVPKGEATLSVSGHGILTGEASWSKTSITAAVPDYCNDLNAMYEAEQIALLHKDYHYNYTINLIIVCDAIDWRIDPCNIVHATASQRAEALYLTKTGDIGPLR